MSSASRDFARLLRWRHAGFRRRRLPYLFEQWVKFFLRELLLPIRRPSTWYLIRRIRAVIAQGETIIEA